MPLLVKHVICVVLTVSITLATFQIFVLPSFSHETKAIVLRAQFVAFMQCVLALTSYAVWKTLRPLPDLLVPNFVQSSSKDHSPLQRNSLRQNERSVTNETNRGTRNLLWEIFVGLFILFSHISYLSNIFILKPDPHWFSVLTYGCLGTQLQFMTGLCLVKCLSFAARWIRVHASDRARTDESNIKGLSQRMTISLTLFYTLCSSFLGLYTAAQLPPVKDVHISIQNLHPSLHSFRIVQLSDIHLGPTVGRTKLQRIVDIVNAEHADAVVITGDLVDGSAERLKEAASPLRGIKSKHGVMFSSGNHEYYTGDVDNWFGLLRSLGVKVLHSSSVKLPSNSQHQICFAGADDLQADKIGYGNHTFNAMKAVSGCGKDQTTILLAHQPKAAKMALDAELGIDLVLSGHTHGGQMFPLMIGAYLMNPFYAGLYQYRGGQVYVSTGTQYWGIPMRIGTTMEITRITLTA